MLYSIEISLNSTHWFLKYVCFLKVWQGFIFGGGGTCLSCLYVVNIIDYKYPDGVINENYSQTTSV